MATQSKFGWLLSGPVPNESSTETTLDISYEMIDAPPIRNDDFNKTLTKFWEISKIPDACNDKEVTEVQKHFQDTIEFNKATGRYNVRLPWKDNKQNLPTYFTLARKRLSTLQHTPKGKPPKLIFKYNEQLLDQLKRGFIEQVLDPNIHRQAHDDEVYAEPMVKVLGLWNTKTDTLSLSLAKLIKEINSTEKISKK